MRFLITFLKTLYVWTVIVFMCSFFAILCLLLFPFVYPFDPKRHSLHYVGYLWVRVVLFCFSPWWAFRVTGREHLPKKGEGVVYVVNHRSMTDTLSVYLLNTRFRWIAKQSIFSVPLLGWAMKSVGYIAIKRGDPKSREVSQKKAKEFVLEGIPMLYFPEGTRIKDPNIFLGPFKKGAFILAKETQVPVIPITILGCDKILPSGAFIPKVGDVDMIIHPRIESKGLSVDELIELTRKSISRPSKTHQHDE